MSSRSRVRVQRIKPIVLLLDLDKTIIGDIIPQSEEYYIIKNINNELKNLDKKTILFNFKRLQNELRQHIIRPNLLNFLNLTRSYNNVEIYIYTASDDRWAKTLIPHIEKTMNFKFNRPILTRNNTIFQNNNFRKSINKVRPLIYKSINEYDDCIEMYQKSLEIRISNNGILQNIYDSIASVYLLKGDY